MSDVKVYGIDLGTTYSCVATIDEFDKPLVLKNGDSDVTPSVVFFESESNVVVGETAKNELEANKRVAFIKREIGNDNYQPACSHPQAQDPVLISALILKKLVQAANETTMQDIKNVVITCPAYFGTKERMQTKQAGEIAGLNVLSIINEPTAAAISYGLTNKENQVVLVYDLGGGTFDVTMIEVSDDTIKVVATGGDSRLGGADWDKEIVKYFAEQFETASGMSGIMSDPETETQLYLAAEKAKKALSDKMSYNARITHDGTTEKIEITRETFESLTSNLLNRTITLTKEVLAKAIDKNEKYSNFDKVLLVGGSCKMPQVKLVVDAALNCDAKLFEPDYAVAKGAAMYAKFQYTISDDASESGGNTTESGPEGIGNKNKKTIINVLSKSYGIGSVLSDKKTEVISTMIFEQDELPLSASKTFVNVEEQDGMQIDVFEMSAATRKDTINDKGTERVAVPRTSGILLDGASLNYGRLFPEGHPVVVTINLDAEGMMLVTACEKETKAKIEINIKITGVRTKEEIAKAKTIMERISVDEN